MRIANAELGTTRNNPLYGTWGNMKTRCYNPNFKDYQYYGGRGIGIHPRWLVFGNFYDDVVTTWVPGLSLDRLHNNEDYGPDNFRWADATEQSQNRRNNQVNPEIVKEIRRMFAKGQTRKDIAAFFGIKYLRVAHIISGRNWSNV